MENNTTTVTTVCNAQLDEENEYGNPKICETKLDEEQHGRFVKNLAGKDRFGNRLSNRFQMGCIRLDCPNCGTVHHVCNVCHGSGPAGYYQGESSGKMLACDNCNSEEATRQKRDSHF